VYVHNLNRQCCTLVIDQQPNKQQNHIICFVAQGIGIKLRAPLEATIRRGCSWSWVPEGSPVKYRIAGRHKPVNKEYWLIILGEAEAARALLAELLCSADKWGLRTDRARIGAQQASDEGCPAFPVCEFDSEQDQEQDWHYDTAEPTPQDLWSAQDAEARAELPVEAAERHEQESGQQADAGSVKSELLAEATEQSGQQATSTRPDIIPATGPRDEEQGHKQAVSTRSDDTPATCSPDDTQSAQQAESTRPGNNEANCQPDETVAGTHAQQ
jgi:hypothetical protein